MEGLPPLWRLSVRTGAGEKAPRLDEEGAGEDEGGRLPVLPVELQVKIRSYLTEAPRSFEKLKAIANWCAQSKEACDESVYYEVVTKCIGVPPKVDVPRVPRISSLWEFGFDDYKSVRALTAVLPSDFNSSMGPLRAQMQEAVTLGKFWRTIMVKCGEELSRLPPSMRGPFLNSNEAQRARWSDIFYWRGLHWLRARVVLGGEVADAPRMYGDGEKSFVEQFPEGSDDWLSANAFVRGMCMEPNFEQHVDGWIEEGWEKPERNFEQRVDGWIEEGWKFDWVLGKVFEKGLDADEMAANRLVADELDAVQTRVMKCFKDRVDALVAAGADLQISVHELMGGWPDARKHIDFEKHYVFRFLKLKVDLLLEHNILVAFDSESDREYSSRVVFMKLMRCFLQVAPQVESWRRHAGFDEYHEDQAKARDALFHSYQYELTMGLCRLIVQLASRKGRMLYVAALETPEQRWKRESVHEEAGLIMRGLIVQGFFDLLTTSEIRPGAWELYDWLRRVDGGFVQWPSLEE